MAVPPLKVIPVLIPSDGAPEYAAAAVLAGNSGKAAIRILMDQVRRNPGIVTGFIAAAAAGVALSPDDIDVFLDWGESLETMPLDQLEQETSAVILALGPSSGRRVTLGTPNSAAFLQEGDWAVDRRECCAR